MTGNHPRHRFVASKLSEVTELVACFMEDRGSITPGFVSNLQGRVADVVKTHYSDREDWEDQYQSLTHVTAPCTPFSSWTDVKDVVLKEKIDVVYTFGCNLLPDWFLEATTTQFVNFHGGLSPWYRGTLTTFWPSYLLQPEKTGYTIHKTTKSIDGGHIYARIPVSIDQSHSLNGLAFQATLDFAQSFHLAIPHLERCLATGRIPKVQSDGKLFLNSDWSPALLVPIYGDMQNLPVAYASQFRDLSARQSEFF